MELIAKNKVSDDLLIDDLLIIGVGASAGGLEALYLLFEQPLPHNTSFVVIQHLSPDFKSITADLLSTHCHKEVITIKDGMQLAKNAIYVLTERKKIEIKDYKFVLAEVQPTTINNALDIFFNSLAIEHGKKSIAIILSGLGRDGTMGAESIKKAGGLVVVQDPHTAEFRAMPSSVIASGCADSILAPALMMDEITSHITQLAQLNQFYGNDEALLLEVLQLINQHTPLDFTNYKRATLIRRIIRKMNQNNIDLLPDFINFLKNDPSQIDSLSKEFMISVTNFFRDPGAFEILKEKVLPDIFANKEIATPLKIWIVGCATGEEAYSMAIIIQEYLEENNLSTEVKIFASDIDKEALAIASKGLYPERIVAEVSKERLSRFFYKVEGNYKIKEHIRNMLIIAQHDITKNPPYYKLDFISCRNLLIYMNPVLQKKILATLHYCLNLGGYLFLGSSESIGDLKPKLAEEDKKWKIFKNVEVATRLENGTYSTPGFKERLSIKLTPVLRSVNPSSPDVLNELIAETISQKTNHAGVCVNEDYKIINTFGDYKKYLLPEMFNFNLLQVLPRELSTVTASGLKQVTQTKDELIINEVVFNNNGISRSVNIYIKPFAEYKSLEKVILVCFTEQAPAYIFANTEIYDAKIHTDRYNLDLEKELKDTQKKLEEVYDELDICHIHAESFNEELISGNEELQSTNEEMQSVNEELQTVNNQYQFKIKELAELNDDLNNYFQSTINGQIYIDKNFIIRKFTPAAIKQINLQESDIGRPISDISTNIKFSTLMEDLHSVISSSQLIEKEIETFDKKWYQMVFHPYVRQQENKIDGAIVSFNDITELKLSQEKLIKINNDHNTFIYSVAHDLSAPLANIEGLIADLKSLDDKNFEERIALTNLIDRSAKNLKKIISELSDITKIENEISGESLETINLNELFKEIELSINGIVVKSKAKITVDFQEPEILFSKKNLRSIFVNLLTNAIKYQFPERDPEIKLRTEKTDGFIVLSIADNGMGIGENHLDKIFSKFKRAHSEMDIEGSGVGLYLIKKMVTNAGGRIEVTSKKGEGSVFSVWFKQGK